MAKTFIGIDIETSGLHPNSKSVIFGMAVNSGKSINVYERKEILKLKAVLEDKSIVKVAHNAAFDCFWLRRVYNIRVRGIWDTMLMEKILIGEIMPQNTKDEAVKEELSTSLYYTLKRYGLPVHDKTQGKEFSEKPINQLLSEKERQYMRNDVAQLLKLQAMQEYRLLKLNLMRVANLENSIVEAVVEMRNNGIGFDKDFWLRLAEANEKKYSQILKRLPSTVSNWNSPQQVKKYFNSIGIPVESLTTIEELQPLYNHKVLDLFIEARSMYKAVTTYGKGWLTDKRKGSTVDEDGKVRADFEQIINTGRFSCNSPNLQQIPRDGQYRQAFVPSKGNVFVIGDFSSQEIGIAAAASGEETWIKAILRGEDVHSLTAMIVFGSQWRDGASKGCTFPFKCKCPTHLDLREKAKVTNFTIIYGGGPTNIANKTKMSLKDAQKLVYKFKKAVPKLNRWLEKNAKFSIDTRTSYSADPFKRRRTLRDPEDWMLSNIGKNNPIQSCGANMIKLSMVSLPENIKLVLTIHDELAVECKKSEAKKALKQLKGVMEKSADYCTGIPGLIKVEPRISNSLLKEK